MPRIGNLIFFLCVLCALCGCSNQSAHATVVWISIDGFRADYLERFHPPTLTRLAREGAITTRETPIFPSLTFPNHIAQVTGRTVDGHGIPLNTFYDVETHKSYSLPDDGEALRAEPIWVTAKRQGMRVAVIDWPMSHAQTGPFKSDYFLDRYDRDQTDEQRLRRVGQILRDDHADKPLRLVMSYISHVDAVGHQFGPDSTQVRRAVEEADAEIDQFFHSVLDWFNSVHADDNEQLYLILTTDHGMAAIHTHVSLDRVIGADLMKGAKSIIGGPVATIYLTDVPAEQKADRARQIVARLRQEPFVSPWTTKDVPERFHFTDPTRIGEVVTLLAPGYLWTEQRLATTQPVPPGTTPGAHGYDPAVCPEMLGLAIVWRYKHPMGGKDLGVVRNTQWHATVARLLNIRPADGADVRAIELP